MREIATPEGSLVLTEAALGAVAGHAALRCPGVAATVPRRLQEELARLLREAPAPGEPREPGTAEIELDPDHCRVALDIVVTYGSRITEVCRAVAAAVAEDLRRAAGFAPDHIDVRVVGVRGPQAPGSGRGPAAPEPPHGGGQRALDPSLPGGGERRPRGPVPPRAPARGGR